MCQRVQTNFTLIQFKVLVDDFSSQPNAIKSKKKLEVKAKIFADQLNENVFPTKKSEERKVFIQEINGRT